MIRKQTKCYIYTRVSTAIQVDGYSLDAQREKLKKYAEFQEYEIAGEYCDGGFSEKNTKDRPEFQRMMKDIQDNKDGVSFVLVFNLPFRRFFFFSGPLKFYGLFKMHVLKLWYRCFFLAAVMKHISANDDIRCEKIKCA